VVLVSAYGATLDTWGHVVHIFTIIDVVGFALKTQCSCSSGFSIDWPPWIGSSVKYDCSLVTRGDVRSRTKSFKRITTWKRSSSHIGFEGTVRMLWFQAPFERIDRQRGGVEPAPRVAETMHTAKGQQQPHLRQ